jgi:hypothetical protein
VSNLDKAACHSEKVGARHHRRHSRKANGRKRQKDFDKNG